MDTLTGIAFSAEPCRPSRADRLCTTKSPESLRILKGRIGTAFNLLVQSAERQPARCDTLFRSRFGIQPVQYAAGRRPAGVSLTGRRFESCEGLQCPLPSKNDSTRSGSAGAIDALAAMAATVPGVLTSTSRCSLNPNHSTTLVTVPESSVYSLRPPAACGRSASAEGAFRDRDRRADRPVASPAVSWPRSGTAAPSRSISFWKMLCK